MSEIKILFIYYMCLVGLQRATLSELIYMADNMAFLPYQVQDEPLYIIHQIDIIVSVSGSNILQSYKEVGGLYNKIRSSASESYKKNSEHFYEQERIFCVHISIQTVHEV